MSKDSFGFLVDEALSQEQYGWDFAFVDGRMIEAGLPWDYVDLANEKLGRASAAADLCTGGGELLAEFDQLPDIMYATESYKPNLSIARTRLDPYGVKVVPESRGLPDTTFDLILNRHGSYDIAELGRIANTGAIFLTQQVGSENLVGLNEMLGSAVVTETWNADVAGAQLLSNGFKILRCEEQKLSTRFMDIGAIVFYLKTVSWQVPDFTIERYAVRLKQLHDQIENRGHLEIEAHRFLIEAIRR
jgi:hypothetical protein